MKYPAGFFAFLTGVKVASLGQTRPIENRLFSSTGNFFKEQMGCSCVEKKQSQTQSNDTTLPPVSSRAPRSIYCLLLLWSAKGAKEWRSSN